MSVELARALEALLLPPGGPLLLGMLGLLFWRRRAGPALVLAALASLYLLSVPRTAFWLNSGLQTIPALNPQQLEQPQAQAILVLGGGRYAEAPEYGGDTVAPILMDRLRYAAWLHRQTGLPVIPSGGSAPEDGVTEAELARRALEQELGARVLAVEDRSRSTQQNAAFSRELLQQLGIEQVFLVTHAWHMPRALASFRKAGVRAIPAPTLFATAGADTWSLGAWIPNADALSASARALHEYLGTIWYRLRGQI